MRVPTETPKLASTSRLVAFGVGRLSVHFLMSGCLTHAHAQTLPPLQLPPCIADMSRWNAVPTGRGSATSKCHRSHLSCSPQLEALALPLWLLSSASRCAWHLSGPCPTRQSWAGWDVGSVSHSCALLLCVFADRVSMCAEDSVARCWQSPKANFNPTSSNCASSNNKTLSLLLLSRLYSFLLTIFQEAMFVLKF